MRRITLIIFIIGLALVFAWALYFPKKDVNQTIFKTLQEQRSKADLYFKGVTVSEMVEGIKYWEIKALNSVINKTTGLNTLKGVKGTFFKKGTPVLKFVAVTALWDTANKKINLIKPIGYDIKSEQESKNIKQEIIYWQEIANTISVFHLPNKYPIPSKLGYWFAAKNLEWSLANQKLVCKEGLTLTKGDFSVVAKKLEADVALEKVILTGNPKAVIRDTELTNLTAEKFEVNANSETIKAKGKVTVTRGDITVWADEATYVMKDRKVILKGKPVFSRGQSKLMGEKVIVSLKDQKVTVEGKTKVIVGEKELKR